MHSKKKEYQTTDLKTYDHSLPFKNRNITIPPQSKE
jgi:hypothetical protein